VSVAVPNVGALLSRHAGRGLTAIVDLTSADEPREISYDELDRACDAIAAGLAARGLGRGDRVGILSLNRPEYVATLFGAMRAGCVPVPLNVKLPADTLAYIADDAGLALLFTDAGHRRVCPSVPVVDFDDGYRDFLKPGTVAAMTPGPTDLCLQPYTSGSTGRPKGVLLHHAGQAWQIDVLVRARNLTCADSIMVAAPLYHKNALVWTKVAVGAGASLVMLPRFDARRYVEAIGRWRVTRLSGVPTMFQLILAERDTLAAIDRTTVRAIGVGSAPASAALMEALERMFPNATATNGYGITEGGPVMFGPHPRGTPRPPASIGYPLPGADVKLVPGPDEGVLFTRNPGVMLGYHKLPEETARRLKDNWLDTGDICRRDADGFYYFVGRDDDMFVCGGENVYPGDVVAVIERHPDVLQAAVIAVDHELKGQVPVAFVVARPGASLTEQAVKQWALAHGPAYAHPRRVIMTAEIPLAGTGKIDRAALRALVQRGEDSVL
jgi:long-chain acyl-CoA synthetase